MVRIGGVNDPTNQKRTPLENEQQQHNNEESLVDKNQIQQWVDRAIGSFQTQSTQEIQNQQSWPLSTTAATTTTTTTTFPNFTNLLPTFSEDDALQSHNKSHLDDASSPSLLTAILDNPNTTQSDFDKAFAAELNQLTFQEREKTWDEIHGVAPIQEETQEFVRTKLVELQQVIYDTPLDQKQCYLEALNDPESRFYVTSFRFAIQFLRAERFNVHLAAKRLLLCCEKRVQFFGRQTLRRPLCLSDLNAEEQQTLKGGAFQVLSQRDRSGRLVVIDTSLCGPKLYTSLYAYYKCFWYIIMSVIEDDEETQKRGIVAIVWWMHHPLRLDQDFDNDLRQETIASLNWLPMRPYSSTHVCIDYNHSTMKQILARFMMAVSPKNMRYGIQLHRGTYTEVLYKLLTYGVPVDCIPVSSSGMVKTKNFGRWIQRQRQKEEYLLSSSHSSSNKNKKKMMTTKKNRVVGDDHDSTPIVQNNNPVAGWFSEDRIDLPSNRDVLLGTGKPLMKHPGNQNYRMIVDNLLQVYDSTPSLRDKAEVTWGVVRYIQENQGGRFLKRDTDSDWWQVVSQQEARDKTGKAFVNQRDSRKKKRPATTGHTTTATTSTKEKAGGTTSSSIAGCGTPTATNPATSARPPTSSMMRFTNMTLREKESTTTADTAIPQSTTTIGTGERAMVWGSSFLPMTREARSTLIPLYNETTTGTGTIRATSGSGGSSYKKRRYDHDEDGGGGGMSSSSSSLSNSCFGWCGGGGGGTTRTSSTATLSSTSFLDGSR